MNQIYMKNQNNIKSTGITSATTALRTRSTETSIHHKTNMQNSMDIFQKSPE